MKPTDEQQKILDNDKKNLIVSASAGSGKTFIVVEQIINLICSAGVPIRRLLILTFTKAAASEMKSRLFKAILSQKSTPFLLEQLDDNGIMLIPVGNSKNQRLKRVFRRAGSYYEQDCGPAVFVDLVGSHGW